jgi:ComF family protein
VPSGPLASPGDLCLRCLLDPPPFAGARALGSHAGGLRRLVHALKFEGRRNVARLLGSRLAAAFARSWRPGEIDAIVPIPLHAERERRRGYNQSALLARELAPYLGIPVLAGALRRPRRTRPQVGLSLGERQRNLRGAFAAEVRGPLAGARILLVDDVVTTGATAESAAGALLDAGAARVSVLAVARTLGGPD